MVADKSKLDRVLADQPLYGDVDKNNTDLDTNLSSSSDESLKIKSENEESSDHILDSSDKKESGDDEPRVFNSTYLCFKPALVRDDEPDHTAEKEKEHPNVTVLKTADSTVKWNYSSMSYKQNLDISEWRDSKSESLNIEDSLSTKKMDEDSVFIRIRQHLVDYQELHGVPRAEYTFSTLIRVMGQATGRCLFALFYVILNIAPAVSEIFLHIARFVLDNIIDIKDTENAKQMVMKTTVFTAQMMCIYVCLVFIFGFIIWPVFRMAFSILTKIMLYD